VASRKPWRVSSPAENFSPNTPNHQVKKVDHPPNNPLIITPLSDFSTKIRKKYIFYLNCGKMQIKKG
jgi:hypothetical protein